MVPKFAQSFAPLGTDRLGRIRKCNVVVYFATLRHVSAGGRAVGNTVTMPTDSRLDWRIESTDNQDWNTEPYRSCWKPAPARNDSARRDNPSNYGKLSTTLLFTQLWEREGRERERERERERDYKTVFHTSTKLLRGSDVVLSPQTLWCRWN